MPNSRQYLQKTNALEKIYTPKIKRIISAFRNQFIQDLKQSGVSTARNNLSKQSMNESIARTLTAIYRQAGLMGARMQHQQTQKLASAKPRVGKKSVLINPKSVQLEIKAGFGRNERWIRDVIEYLRFHLLKFVGGITETMREDILRTLEKGAEEGWSIDIIVTELRRVNVIEARARVIARTEINRASNVGHSVAAKDLPYEVDKKWSAAKDHRTRHSHNKVNNHITDENGYFQVPIYKGDKPTGLFDQMQYPGDPEASPGNTINCRCRVLYIPKRDSAGRLVMRDRNQATVIPIRRVPSYTPAQIAAILKENIYIGVEK